MPTTKSSFAAARDSSIFDEIVDRRNSNSMKWACAHKLLAPDEAAADPLSMWVTDPQMLEIFALGREALSGGQKSFQVQAFPFRMTPANMAKHRNSPHLPFGA